MRIPDIKKAFVLLLALVVVLGAGGYAGRKLYVSARQARLVKNAREYLDKSKPKEAMLCIQGALRWNANNVEACRLMAELLESERSPAAVLWRSRVVELNNSSTEDRLSLVVAALAARDYTTATNALEGIPEADKKTAKYHTLAGTVSVARGNPAEAEYHFLEAGKLEPENPSPQLNLAVIRLVQTNAQALAQARSTLMGLSENPTNEEMRCRALRELFADAIRHNQTNTALEVSRKLLLETNSVFNDRLVRLEVLRVVGDPAFDPTLQAFQENASKEPGKAYEMAAWQFKSASPAKALEWLQSLRADLQTNQALVVLAAECRAAMRDWTGLQNSIQNQEWGELEFIRRAFLARALRAQSLDNSAKLEWAQAVKLATGRRGAIGMLLRMAAQWRWNTEAEEILSIIVNRYPSEQWAYVALSQALHASGQTRPLMALCSVQAKRNPADLSAKNNLAMTALLLGAEEMKPHDLAREVYQKAPTNSSFISTYAFSLYLQNKTNEALQMMEKLTPQQLARPSIAGYYALALKVNGDSAKAKQYFDRLSGTNAPLLLPEEKKLMDRARASL